MERLISLGRFPIKKKHVALLLLALLVLSLLPPLWISFFNRPAADDYSYGSRAAHALRETRALFPVIKAAFLESKAIFHSWQGTYAAVFLFALQPGILSEQAYFLATFVLLLTLVAATFFFLHALIVSRLKGDSWDFLIIASAAAFLSVQFLPVASEGFYWFNGGVFYTFFYSLLLFLLGILMKQITSKSWPRLLLRSVCALLLSLAIGGGNYITGLMGVLLLGLLVLWQLVNREKCPWLSMASLLLLTIGLIVSATAPGNQVRAAAMLQEGVVPLGLFQAILVSFEKGYAYFVNWAKPWLVAAVLLLSPLFLKLAKGSGWRFRYPLLVILLAFCLFCAQLSPPAMMSVLGSGRHLNIIYYAYILTLLFMAFYIIGWLWRLYERQPAFQQQVNNFLQKPWARLLPLLCAVVLLLVIVSGILGRDWLSRAALDSLNNGEAAQFAHTRDQRVLTYQDPQVRDAVVDHLPARPRIFLQTDLWYKDWWVNQAVADYYDKDSVSLVE